MASIDVPKETYSRVMTSADYKVWQNTADERELPSAAYWRDPGHISLVFEDEVAAIAFKMR